MENKINNCVTCAEMGGIMLVSFSVSNFKTFKESSTLSLIASNYDKKIRVEENIILDEKNKLKLLKSAVIYGANASGKSKFIEAINFMVRFAIESSNNSQKGDRIQVEPFRLDQASATEPSEFEIIFTFEGTLYRYGFEVNKDKVVAEWLYFKPKTKEVELFYREGQEFSTHAKLFKKGGFAVREGLVRENTLLLSLAAQLNDALAIKVIKWFQNLRVISGLREENYRNYTLFRTTNSQGKQKILELLRGADFGIEDFQLEIMDSDNLPAGLPKELKERIMQEAKEDQLEIISDILTAHKVYNDNAEHVSDVHFSMEEHESSGTRKFFALSGPLLDVLENGYTLFVDELDSKLHPNLVCKIVEMFNSAEMNPNNAQLVFNTHDTNLLSSGLFRRDQIWFAEKDKFGAANLYSLADFKNIRNKEALEENYIRGKYGGVPYLEFFDSGMQVDEDS